MLKILAIVFPVFIIIAAGYFFRRKNLIEEQATHYLNTFVYYVSLPAIITISFWKINWHEESIGSLFLLNTFIVLIFAAILLFVLSVFIKSKSLRAAILMTSLVGNTVYMGYPILGPALGSDVLSSVVGTTTIHLVLGIVISVLIADYLISKSSNSKKLIWDFIKNPLMVALFIGLVLSFIPFQGWLTDILQNAVGMLGATASPLALFALGAFMSGKFNPSHFVASFGSSAIKLILFPLFAAGVAALWGVNSFQVISTAVATMPVAATTFVIAEQHKLDKAFVANTIILSTILSLFTITIFLLYLLT